MIKSIEGENFRIEKKRKGKSFASARDVHTYIHTYVQDELEGQGKGKVWGLLASADGNGRVCISVGYAKQQHIHIYIYV